jgi:hypothetical protein
VVATGLGKPAGLQQAAMRVVRSETDAKEPNYAVLDKPTVQRRAVGDDLEESPETLEMLDIPAFLRRQVD